MKMLRHLFKITPGATLTPDRGLRTAGAFGLSLLVLAAFGRTPFGGALGLGFLLGVLFTSFGDVGTSVRARGVAMSALTLGGPLAMAAGRSLAASWWVAALAVFGVTLVAGFLFIYGPLVSLVGMLLSIVFVVALGIDGGPATALPSALGFLLGGVVVLLLLLVSALPTLLRERAHHTAAPPASAQAPSLSLVTLLAHLDVRAPLFRQGLLRALGAGGAAALAWKLGTPYPQWAPIAVIACVQPERGTSVRTAVQNSIGTVLGVLLADVLIGSAQPPVVVALIVVVVVFIAFTVKDLNHVLFTFFMTNLTLLLIHLSSPGVSPIRLRVFSVLVGSGIALTATFLDQWLAARRPSHATPPPEGPAAARAP
jgi:hypothetical protein